MLKRCLIILFSAVSLSGLTQSLAGINYRYLYDPQNEIRFPMKIVNENNQLSVFFNLQVTGAQDSPKDYRIKWERHESYISREGVVLPQADSAATTGRLSFPEPEKPWLLVARVFNAVINKRFTYYVVMDSKYPVDGYLEDASGVLFDSFVREGKEVVVHGANPDKPVHFFFYRTDFPAALPPFADKEPAPERFLFADSSFTVANGQKILFKSRGMYLAQQDTVAARGFSFRVVNAAFPRFTRAEDIPAPLVFVSTKDEHDELVAAAGDKSKIDKVILDITGNRDRAKTFMKAYFRNIELANLNFTTYKEGWKTDRGMIYLVFGLPDDISRTGANEIWTYKNLKERFTFIKSGSVYEPQHFTLLRSSRLSTTWYSTIDLWRKSQF